MFNEPDKNKYIEDIEFIRVLNSLKEYGIEIENQTKRPYVSSTNVLIPKDFSFDNINNLYYINDSFGKTEFIIFNKKGTYIELIQYTYTGYDYDRSKTPRLQLRYITYNDKYNEFEEFFNKENLEINEFFAMKKHFTFFTLHDVPSTYINVMRIPNFQDKFKYSIINGNHDDYLTALKANLSGSRCDIYNYYTRFNSESMLDIANNFLETCKSNYIRKPHAFQLAR